MILIFGANGQLGTSLQRVFTTNNVDFMALTENEVDITDHQNIHTIITNYAPRYIINAAAYTDVEKAEEDEERAMKINAHAVGFMAKAAKDVNAYFIHISTDYVFNGKTHSPYTETMQGHPLNIYGKSKLIGEELAYKNNPLTLILRTSWLYSPFGKNFFLTMHKLISQNTNLNVIVDQIGTPTYVGSLSLAIHSIIPKLSPLNVGLYHYSDEGVASWYDFAIAISTLHSNYTGSITPILSKNYPTKAERPFFSVLDKEKIKKTFELTIPHWQKGVIQCYNSL